MVGGLKTPFENPDPAACIFSRIRQHFCEHSFAHMVRTRTCNKDAARPKQPHGAVVDFFLPPECAFKAFLVFRECGRVENDRVIPGALSMPVAEEVKSVGFNGFYVREAIAVCISAD